jgi:rubrerythrin
MWPFKTLGSASEVPKSWEDRLRSVEKTQEDLAGSVKKLRLEWEDVYDRLVKAAARLNARDRAEQRRVEEATEPSAVVDMDAINERIRKGENPFGPTARRW